MKKIVCLLAISAMAFACTSVSKTSVGGKEIVHVTKLNIQLFNGGGAPVSECLNALSDEKAKRVISASGPATGGLFGMTRSVSTIGLDMCNAVGEK
jgi:hypothetical protein